MEIIMNVGGGGQCECDKKYSKYMSLKKNIFVKKSGRGWRLPVCHPLGSASAYIMDRRSILI